MTFRMDRQHMKSLWLTLCCFACLTGGQTGFAATTLSLSPAGDGSYVMQGVGVENTAAMDIVLTYDASTLETPKVTQGALISGALMAVNDTTPGTVRLGIIRVTPVSGSGIIATLAFIRKGGAVGRILSLQAVLSTGDGKQLPVVVQVTNTPLADVAALEGTPQQPATPGTGVLLSAPSASVRSALPGAATALQEKPAIEEAKGVPDASPPLSIGAGAAPKGMTLSSASVESRSPVSVLERFRLYRGERSVNELVALFVQAEPTVFQQDPPVALSDGVSTVTISFVTGSAEGPAPDIALQGGRLVSLKRDRDRPTVWMFVVKPYRGEVAASLVVPGKGSLQEYPLTIAPPITDGQVRVSEKDFEAYLRGKGADLNGDGKRDYVDDYIYAVNYLAATGRAGRGEK